MRRFSREYVLVDGVRYYLVSVKEPGMGWEPVGFFEKLGEKDEFGYLVGRQLKCPHRGEVPSLAWVPLPDTWIMVRNVCQKCWGIHRQPDGKYNCILRSKMVKMYRDGVALR